MTSVIFVHGTGVRKESYLNTFSVIEKALYVRQPDLQLVACLWGETLGATLRQAGASIPSYATARTIEGVSDVDQETVLWQLLYQDPYFELRSLALQQGEGEELVPNQLPPWLTLQRQVEQFAPSLDLQSLLANHHLEQAWHAAFRQVKDYFTLHAATIGAAEPQPLARAMVAQTLVLAEKEGIPALDGATRDRMVELIVAGLGGQPRGIGQWFGDQIKGLALRFATDKIERKRGVISDSVYPAAADIVLYQTRGQAIRQFIAQQVRATPGPVYLLAHSLGGIACVDLLVMEPLPNLTGLITVGSQAPLLYELDALTSLRYGEPLPTHFPKWLNFYDPHDFLSYIGAALFPERVTDVQVESRQPFPQAHSAYWNNSQLWQTVKEFLA